MRSFFIALKFLTLFPLPAGALRPREIGRASGFFPAAGFIVGLILVVLNRLLEPYLASELLGMILVVVLICLTAGRQLKGLKASFDEIGFHAGAGQGMGGRAEIFGFLAVVVVFLLKSRAIEVMGESRTQGLLLAPVLGCWSMVILAYGSRVKTDGESETALDAVRGIYLFWATAVTLPLMVFFSGVVGLWIALWVSLLALSLGSFVRRRRQRLHQSHLGAVAEMSEALAMVLYATL
jgi:adenosylcobinamide-GDP ribazoletransferase